MMTTSRKSYYHIRLVRLAALLLASSLAGCVAVSSMPDGQITMMSPQMSQERTMLPLSLVPTPGPLKYLPVKGCNYEATSASSSTSSNRGSGSVSVRPLRDRFLLVDNYNGKISSFLLNPSGKILDFNATDAQGKQQTADTQSADQYSYIVLEYSPNPLRPGDTAALVKTKDGKVAGAYYYRGVTPINGSTGYVMDLKIPVPNSTMGDVLVGFDIVDTKTMLPTHLVVDTGPTQIRFNITSCTP